MSENNKDELLDSTEVKKEEIKEEKDNKIGQFTPASLTLMILFVLILVFGGCWYTYYQYKRMEEINSSKE